MSGIYRMPAREYARCGTEKLPEHFQTRVGICIERAELEL